MRCFIYKGRKRPDTYLYLTEAGQFDSVPSDLTEAFGELEFVMDLVLTPCRKLANDDALQVLRNLLRRGFHVQLPPPDALWSLSEDGKRTSGLH